MESEPTTVVETAEITAVSDDQWDPFESIQIAWNHGNEDVARRVFHALDTSGFSALDRFDEWRMWRTRLHVRSWNARDLGLFGENISSLLVDGDDVWLGTWTGGVSRLSWPLNHARAYDPGSASLAVRTVDSIQRRDNAIWIVRYGAVESFNKTSERWSSIAELPIRERLKDLAFLGGRQYLASLGKGFWIYDGREWSQEHSPGLFITCIESSFDNSGLWVGTMDRGLFYYDETHQGRSWSRPPEGPLREVNVTSLAEVDDSLYIGTYGQGAFVWDLNTGHVISLNPEVSANQWIMDVEDSPDRVYLATFGDGILHFDKNERSWGALTMEDGLPTGDIACLQWDSGILWAGTLGGGLVAIREDFHAN